MAWNLFRDQGTEARLVEVQAELSAQRTRADMLEESFADAQAALRVDNLGWELMVGAGSRDLPLPARREASDRIATALVVNPMLSQGLEMRQALVWGAGVKISVKGDGGQDVNSVLQGFLGDRANRATFASTPAKMGWERRLCCDGELFAALPTDRSSGRVRVRLIPSAEIVDVICDPEDSVTPILFLRQWNDASGRTHKLFYPAAWYDPVREPDTSLTGGVEIRWDAPMLATMVNVLGGRGIGDMFSVLPWARRYDEFLQDWARLNKSLSRFSWRTTTKHDRTQQAADAARAQTSVGGGVAIGQGQTFEAINKTGANIDANSGRPLAAMVAAGLGLPVTSLLADPGVTGARAVASTVTDLAIQTFESRRRVWRDFIDDVCRYVIDASIFYGGLHGERVRDGDFCYGRLPDGTDDSIEIEFPATDRGEAKTRIEAVVQAVQAGLLHPLDGVQETVTALEVQEPDEAMARMKDGTGSYLNPQTAADVALQKQMLAGNIG